jgi:hypothetical protein
MTPVEGKGVRPYEAPANGWLPCSAIRYEITQAPQRSIPATAPIASA